MCQFTFSSSFISLSYRLYVTHFEERLVLVGFASFFSFKALAEAAFAVTDFVVALLTQFLFVQWPFITIEPQVQNSAKSITPSIYSKYTTKTVFIIIFTKI